ADVRGFRDAAAALAHRADARGRGHQRSLARRCSDPVVRLRLRAHDRIGICRKSRAVRRARHLRRAAGTYLFTRSVVLLGAGRAAVFPSLVPGFTLLIGFLTLGEVPTLAQLAGFAIVLLGFRLTQRN